MGFFDSGRHLLQRCAVVDATTFAVVFCRKRYNGTDDDLRLWKGRGQLILWIGGWVTLIARTASKDALYDCEPLTSNNAW